MTGSVGESSAIRKVLVNAAIGNLTYYPTCRAVGTRLHQFRRSIRRSRSRACAYFLWHSIRADISIVPVGSLRTLSLIRACMKMARASSPLETWPYPQPVSLCPYKKPVPVRVLRYSCEGMNLLSIGAITRIIWRCLEDVCQNPY
jgi:hypothetical protein